MKKNVYMGIPVKSWMSEKNIKYITFNVTDDCNLACTYCYFLNKSNKKRMSFDVAKKAVDYILDDKDNQCFDGVVWDFIGGEPSLEADLICQICDYIILQMYLKKHKWLYCYKFMMCSNGLLYDTPNVQKIVRKYYTNFQISISIDGSKEKHDLSRKRKDGSGSYDDIVRIIPLWLKQQGVHSTKATFAHQDIVFLKDSIVNLWNLGITNVMANVVFENVWQEGDDVIFENQLKELADYIIDNKLWDKYSVRFFAHSLGTPLHDDMLCHNFCGAGKMLAISTDGKFFPCMRFMESALNSGKKPLVVGNIYDGLNKEKLRTFYALGLEDQSAKECVNCTIATGCAWCSGLNYNCSDNDSIFERKTYICKMHQANVRANAYFWNRYEEATGNISPLSIAAIENKSRQKKYAYIILDSQASPLCQYISNTTENNTYNSNCLEEILSYCQKNSLTPIFNSTVEEKYARKGIVVLHCKEQSDAPFKCELIYDEDVDNIGQHQDCQSVIYITETNNINRLSKNIIKIFDSYPNDTNINLYFKDIYNFTNDTLMYYINELQIISSYLIQQWENENIINLNVLTHLFFNRNHSSCGAGTDLIAIDGDGIIYVCPAFYYDSKVKNEGIIGNISRGIYRKIDHLCKSDKLFTCRNCKATHCTQCVYLNKKYTGEYCVPPEIQCVKSNIEREISLLLFRKLMDIGFPIYNIPNYSQLIDIKLDPIAAEHPKQNINKYDIPKLQKILSKNNELLIRKDRLCQK